MFRKLVGTIFLATLLLVFVACINSGESAVKNANVATATESKRPPITTFGDPILVRASRAIIVEVADVKRNLETGEINMTFKLFAGKEILQARGQYRISGWGGPHQALLSKEGYVVDNSGIGFLPLEGGTHEGRMVVLGGASFSDAERRHVLEGDALQQIRALMLDLGIVYSTKGKDPRLDMGDAVPGDSLHIFPAAIVKKGEGWPEFPFGTRVSVLRSATRERPESSHGPHTLEVSVHPPDGMPYQTVLYEGAGFGQQSPERIILPLIAPPGIDAQILELQQGDTIHVFVDR